MNNYWMKDMKNRECPECGVRLEFGSGCYFCPSCGYGKCGKYKAHASIAFIVAAFLVVGHVESRPDPVPVPAPVKIAKSATQEKIETILPPAIAKPIAERTVYPKTLAAIAHTESRGNHKAVGDKGQSRGAFQVQAKHWGIVPDSIEKQVDQANVIFMSLVREYGYREAVKRWNGDGPKADKYQRTVLALVRELEK